MDEKLQFIKEYLEAEYAKFWANHLNDVLEYLRDKVADSDLVVVGKLLESLAIYHEAAVEFDTDTLSFRAL